MRLTSGHYAALIIHRRRLLSKDIYQELYGRMLVQDKVAACADVHFWLRAPCTARGEGGEQNGSPCVLYPLTAVHLPEQIFRYMISKVLCADLPSLGDPKRATAEVTGTVAGKKLRSLTSARGREYPRAQAHTSGVQGDLPPTTRYLVSAMLYHAQRTWHPCGGDSPTAQRVSSILSSHRTSIVCVRHGVWILPSTPRPSSQAMGLKQMIASFMFVGHSVDERPELRLSAFPGGLVLRYSQPS